MIKKITKDLITYINENRSRVSVAPFKLKSSNTPVFQSQGDKSLDEYWQKRDCAIACLYMAKQTIKGDDSNFSLKDLTLMVLANGGYDIKTDTGWYHNSLISTAKELGLDANIHKYVGFYSQAKLIKNGNIILSSLQSPQGGHMILIYGLDVTSKGEMGFIYHDPSIMSGGKNKFISKKAFSKLSKKQAISIKHVKKS